MSESNAAIKLLQEVALERIRSRVKYVAGLRAIDFPCDLTIPAVPPSVNLAKGKHWTVYHTANIVWKDHLALSVKAAKFKVPEPPLVMLYRIWSKRERDAQNCEKALTDALYKDDSQVLPWPLFGGIDKKNPRTELWFVTLEKR